MKTRVKFESALSLQVGQFSVGVNTEGAQLDLAEGWLSRIRRRPAVAALIVLATVVGGLAAFTKSARELLALVSPPTHHGPWKPTDFAGTRWKGSTMILKEDQFDFTLEFYPDGKCLFSAPDDLDLGECSWQLDMNRLTLAFGRGLQARGHIDADGTAIGRRIFTPATGTFVVAESKLAGQMYFTYGSDVIRSPVFATLR